MNLPEILTSLSLQLSAALGIPAEKIHPDSRLVADLGAESIDLIDLTFRIEKTFDLEIPEGELFEDPKHPAHLLTVAEVAAYIAHRKNPT